MKVNCIKVLLLFWLFAAVVACQNGRFNTEIASLQTPSQTKCKPFDETVYSEFIYLYNGKGCKLVTYSPDRKYLSYVTLTKQNQGREIYYADTVKTVDFGSGGSEKTFQVSGKKNYIIQIGWGPTDELMVWEKTWEGPLILSVYQTGVGSVLYTTNANDLTVEWNLQQTAFYLLFHDEYGRVLCSDRLTGYDFQLFLPLPDLYKELEVIPGNTDNLDVVPYGWSLDGRKLWLSVSHLTLESDTGQYIIGPKQAGVIDLSGKEPKYTTLASSDTLDYYYNENSQSGIYSKPYVPQVCPQ